MVGNDWLNVFLEIQKLSNFQTPYYIGRFVPGRLTSKGIKGPANLTKFVVCGKFNHGTHTTGKILSHSNVALYPLETFNIETVYHYSVINSF